jgi:hypothetical protein
VLTWCAANAVVEMDAAGSLKVNRRKSTEKIDGIVALAMARSGGGWPRRRRMRLIFGSCEAACQNQRALTSQSKTMLGHGGGLTERY